MTTQLISSTISQTCFTDDIVVKFSLSVLLFRPKGNFLRSVL